MKILSNKQIFSDGKHNAFTSISKFKGKYFIVFRHGESHVSLDGKIVAITSEDLKVWSLPSVVADIETDDRDPKLFVFNDKLYCAYQTRHLKDNDPKQSVAEPMITWTEDGFNWSIPVKMIDLMGVPWYVHQGADGKFYSALYTFEDRTDGRTWKVVLLKTADPEKKWEQQSVIWQGESANETDILFSGDKLYAVIRRERMNTVIVSSVMPYTTWEKVYELPFEVHAPVLYPSQQNTGGFYIIGRLIQRTTEFGLPYHEVAVFEWAPVTGFKKHCIFVSGYGVDSSYAGICGIDGQPDELAVSYYFGTSQQASIFVARIKT
ncbi:MAG: hypothetical protein WC955_03555 [Elusimicrobiota bacterium]